MLDFHLGWKCNFPTNPNEPAVFSRTIISWDGLYFPEKAYDFLISLFVGDLLHAIFFAKKHYDRSDKAMGYVDLI